MRRHDMREAFSMITAIFVIVIMASIGAFVMSISGKIVKTTTAQYQHEQAELYAKSYTEYAIMAVTANNRTTECLETVNGDIGDYDNGSGYQVRTHISYIVNDSVDVNNCAGTRVLSDEVTTDSTPLTIIIDAYVDYKDPDNIEQKLTVHRRSIQKI